MKIPALLANFTACRDADGNVLGCSFQVVHPLAMGGDPALTVEVDIGRDGVVFGNVPRWVEMMDPVDVGHHEDELEPVGRHEDGRPIYRREEVIALAEGLAAADAGPLSVLEEIQGKGPK